VKRSLDIAAVALTSLLLLGFAVLSLRGLIDPQPASVRFGIPVSDAAGALFYRVYLSRGIVGVDEHGKTGQSLLFGFHRAPSVVVAVNRYWRNSADSSKKRVENTTRDISRVPD
jgi:hypothetical protein